MNIDRCDYIRESVFGDWCDLCDHPCGLVDGTGVCWAKSDKCKGCPVYTKCFNRDHMDDDCKEFLIEQGEINYSAMEIKG